MRGDSASRNCQPNMAFMVHDASPEIKNRKEVGCETHLLWRRRSSHLLKRTENMCSLSCFINGLLRVLIPKPASS
jgi:hypothetical protein